MRRPPARPWKPFGLPRTRIGRRRWPRYLVFAVAAHAHCEAAGPLSPGPMGHCVCRVRRGGGGGLVVVVGEGGGGEEPSPMRQCICDLCHLAVRGRNSCRERGAHAVAAVSGGRRAEGAPQRACIMLRRVCPKKNRSCTAWKGGGGRRKMDAYPLSERKANGLQTFGAGLQRQRS
jgi:hypothetical protein